MAGGWGKRATGQTDKKLEEDALFREIGGQLDASNFDYTKWQRSERPQEKLTSRPPPAPRKKILPSRLWESATNLNSPQVVIGPRASSANSACNKRGKKSEKIQIENENKKRQDRIKILQLRIMARRKTIEEYRKRQGQLLDDNLSLRTHIAEYEGEAHNQVKDLLTKYEKFTGGISTLSERFTDQYNNANDNLNKTKTTLERELQALQLQVAEVEKKVQAQQDELYILLNYKDKEYPVKSLKISELHRELSQLDITQEEEETELKHVVSMELDKFVKEQNYNQKFIMERVTQETLLKMPPMMKQMAMHNLVMEKEIKVHSTEVEELEELNKTLEAEVKSLLKSPKTSIRQQMFPEFFPDRGKCTPDMDVVLDIPTQEWLPI